MELGQPKGYPGGFDPQPITAIFIFFSISVTEKTMIPSRRTPPKSPVPSRGTLPR